MSRVFYLPRTSLRTRLALAMPARFVRVEAARVGDDCTTFVQITITCGGAA